MKTSVLSVTFSVTDSTETAHSNIYGTENVGTSEQNVWFGFGSVGNS